jgi:hypothetical protein
MINKLLLVGTGHGQLYLYTTGRGKKKKTTGNLFLIKKSSVKMNQF